MPAFKNRALAEYRRKEDDAVREELVAAGIPVLTLPTHTNMEVKTSHIGVLNGFVFARAWRYWICQGDMPLGAAKEIYRLYGDLSIRAEGDASNPEPTGYCPKIKNEAKALAEKMREQNATTTEILAELGKIKEVPGTPRFVSVYHIDTSEGLAALAKYIYENEIYAYNGEPGSYAASVFK